MGYSFVANYAQITYLTAAQFCNNNRIAHSGSGGAGNPTSRGLAPPHAPTNMESAMAFIPVELVAQFAMHYEWDGQKVENAIYAKRLAGWDTDSLLDAAGIIRTTLIDVLAPLRAENCIWNEIVCTDLTAFDAVQAVYNFDAPSPGTDTGEPMPNNVTWCVKFLTEQRGRSYRGRNYIVGLTVSEVLGNLIDSANADTIVDAYNQTFSDLAAANYLPVVVSRYFNNAPRVAGISTLITDCTYTDLVLDSQRKRLPGRGN